MLEPNAHIIDDLKQLNSNTKKVLVLTRAMTKKTNNDRASENTTNEKFINEKVDINVYDNLGSFN